MSRKADLYIRVSTEEQAEKGYSQRDQEERLKKYCEIKNISIRNIFIEDHSAKTFKRPEWEKYLNYLRKNKKNKESTILLFTKWDRFSRNAGDAYQMINTLRTFWVEPEAIEQPLDLTIPENKIMLAFYLAAPEVENDRRSLNVFHGMRRAKKEGRYMATAPVGYSNYQSLDKKKSIIINKEEAPLLKWAFEQIASNHYNTEQIWKLVKQKANGIKRFSKNNFWIAIRNPLYCGKLFIPPYKEEKGKFIYGQHEPLISEKLFNDVQNILDGRTRQLKPKVVSTENLPLRGFLKCPNCEKLLTGSASRGKMGKYYHYYHCTKSCKIRFKAELVNEAFEKQLKNLIPKKEYLDLFIEAFKIDYKNKTKLNKNERMSILQEIDTLNNRYQNALIKNIDNQIDEIDFKKIKILTLNKIEELEVKLNNLSIVNTEIEKILIHSLSNIADLHLRYINGNNEEKRLIISSMFPEKLEFDGTLLRTCRINFAVNLIYQNNSKLKLKKNGTNLNFIDLSRSVDPQGFEPRQTVPKTGVLPLHHGSALNCECKYNLILILYKKEN